MCDSSNENRGLHRETGNEDTLDPVSERLGVPRSKPVMGEVGKLLSVGWCIACRGSTGNSSLACVHRALSNRLTDAMGNEASSVIERVARGQTQGTQPALRHGIDVVVLGNERVDEDRSNLGQHILRPDATILKSATDERSSDLQRRVEVDDAEGSWWVPTSTASMHVLAGQGIVPGRIGDAQVKAAATDVAHYAAAAQSNASRSSSSTSASSPVAMASRIDRPP